VFVCEDVSNSQHTAALDSVGNPDNPERAQFVQVTKIEFLMYVLDHLSIAEMAEMEAVLKVFDALDQAGRGVLTLKQARRALQVRSTRQRHAVYHTSYEATGILPLRPGQLDESGLEGRYSRLARDAYRSMPHGARGPSCSSAKAPLLPTTAPAPAAAPKYAGEPAPPCTPSPGE
jgi:hypothetical protein